MYKIIFYIKSNINCFNFCIYKVAQKIMDTLFAMARAMEGGILLFKLHKLTSLGILMSIVVFIFLHKSNSHFQNSKYFELCYFFLNIIFIIELSCLMGFKVGLELRRGLLPTLWVLLIGVARSHHIFYAPRWGWFFYFGSPTTYS